MTEIANTGTQDYPTQGRLENLAMQAQMFVQNACLNLLQLGRVFTEAKPLVKHGEWDAWIKENANMSRRSAEQYMQAYAEFGLDPKIAELGTTKVLKLLPIKTEEREKLLAENDVSAMSTRQLDEEIRKRRTQMEKDIREEMQDEINREREARGAAEKKGKEQQAEIDRLSKGKNDSDEKVDHLAHENLRLKSELKERDALLEEQQADYNKAQEELLNLKSTIAKGDAERAPAEQLTPDIFAGAVRSFIGTCARMPHMGKVFSGMGQTEINEYDELLRTVESWARESRIALDTVTVDGMVIDNE